MLYRRIFLEEELIMIVDFTNDINHIRTLSGTNYEKTLIYSSIQNDTKCTVRPYVYPRITSHNHHVGAKMKKAAVLYHALPEGFKESLKKYAHFYNKQWLPQKKLPISAYNVFIMALCSHTVRLVYLFSMETIVSHFGGTIGEWISHGLLRKVKGKLSEAEAIIEHEESAGLDFISMMYLLSMCSRLQVSGFGFQDGSFQFSGFGFADGWFQVSGFGSAGNVSNGEEGGALRENLESGGFT